MRPEQRQRDPIKSRGALMDGARKVRNTLLILIFVIAGGTTGFMAIEKMSALDAFYMTMITISTVGFREVGVLSATGKMFTVLLIMSGLVTAAYGLGAITSFVLEGEFRQLLRRRAMENKIERLKEHYLVCGAGRTGRYVIDQFRRKGISFVAIDHDVEKAQRLAE